MEETLRFGTVSVYLGEKSGKFPDGNQVIICGGDTRVAFDTPLVANRIGAAFESVDLVILGHVHEDHVAGLHRVPHAKVQVHEGDLAALQSWQGLERHYGYSREVFGMIRPRLERDYYYRPRPDATAYRDGEVWDLGGGVTVRAHHMPGHTAGHSVLVVENEGLAFLGDIDLTGFGPYYGDGTSSLRDFRHTLAAVADLDVNTWVTSHHRAVLTDRTAFLDALALFAAKIEQRTAHLLSHLAEGPLSLEQLVCKRVIYPVGYQAPFVEAAERRSIRMHLDELLAQGQVRVLDDGRYLVC